MSKRQNALTPALVSQAELRWILLVALVFVGLTALPYIYAAGAAPKGLIFGGILVNPEDGNTYLAKIRQGYDGAWLYTLAYSPEKEPGILIYTLYIIIGHIARLTSLPKILLYHATRVAAGILLIVAVYRLACELTPDVSARRWGAFIAAFGSGLGIVTQVVGRSVNGYLPVDFYTPESNIFYSILTNPHFPFAVALESVLKPCSRQKKSGKLGE